jgi:hypothetical protein
MNLSFKLNERVSFNGPYGIIKFGDIKKIMHTNVNANIETKFDILDSNGVLFSDIPEACVRAAQNVNINLSIRTGGTEQDLLDALETGNVQKVADSLCFGADPRTAIEQVTRNFIISSFEIKVAKPFGIAWAWSQGEDASAFRDRTIEYIAHIVERFNLSNIFVDTASGPQLDKLAESVGIKRREAECVHNFVKYHGLMESFEYCSICDQKKGK